jgi:putative ABC transport system ATP-binding protein
MVELRNITKTYLSNGIKINALDNISLDIDEGEFIVIRGASGSGKTTLLLTLGTMLKPTEGNYLFDNNEVYSMNGKERNIFRAKNIGFVFQMFHLLPYLSVIENVTVPTLGKNIVKAKEILNELGLSKRINHKPFALSSGEKQRTAVARALINNPKLILADEPTGNLDPDNAEEVIRLFSKFHKDGGTVVVVTHGSEVEQFANRVFTMKDGKIFE